MSLHLLYRYTGLQRDHSLSALTQCSRSLLSITSNVGFQAHSAAGNVWQDANTDHNARRTGQEIRGFHASVWIT